MKVPTKIRCDGFILRKLNSSDAHSICDYIKDKEIVRYTENIPHPYTKKDAFVFINKSTKEWRLGTAYNFGLEINGNIVGGCGLNKVDLKNRRATLGYWLGKKFWGKGIMSKAAGEVVKFAFTTLKLHRLKVWHFEDNIASGKIIQKLGFKREGMHRKEFFRENKWHNLIYYGLLEEEYFKR